MLSGGSHPSDPPVIPANREEVLLMATLTAWAFNTVDGAEQASRDCRHCSLKS